MVPRMNDDLKSAWVERQRSRGKNLDSVLLKGLSVENNRIIHEWHCSVVRYGLQKIEPSNHDMLVDLGCGYGRISKFVSDNFDCYVVGVDFVRGYCKDAEDSADGVVCARLADIPFKKESISSVLFITSLMYLSSSELDLAMKRLDSAVRPGGLVLLIEPGRVFHALLQKLRISAPERNLNFNGFSTGKFESLGANLGWKVLGVGGNVGFTSVLPLLLLFRNVKWISLRLTHLAEWIDSPNRAGWVSRLRVFAMHRWVIYSVRSR